MGENWLTQGVLNGWAIAVIAYLLGLLTAWAFRRTAEPDSSEPAADEKGDLEADPSQAAKPQTDVAQAKKSDAASSAALSALEAEINEAKTILEADAEEHAVMADMLAGIDDAVKRANGRLKLILKSIGNGNNGA